MKSTHVINIFGKRFSRRLQPSTMVINRRDGIVITIPEKGITQSGMIKANVLKKLTSLTVENVSFLEKHYAITFTLNGDKAIA